MAIFGPIAAALADEGCTAEQVAAAVAAIEAAKEREREERLARLREGARLRQQRCRERWREYFLFGGRSIPGLLPGYG